MLLLLDKSLGYVVHRSKQNKNKNNVTNNQPKRRGHKNHYANILGDKNSISKPYEDIHQIRQIHTYVTFANFSVIICYLILDK